MQHENLIEVLDKAYTEGQPLVSDETYDAIRKEEESNNPELINKVGSEPKVPVKLPVITSSLNKLRETDDKGLVLWLEKQEVSSVYVSDKLDGISALYTTTNGFFKLLSRGNGVYGEDISHLIPYLNLPRMSGLIVRGELVLPKSIDKGRNIVAGMANSKHKVLDEEIAKQIKFIAHRLYGYTLINLMYDQLITLGFDVVHHKFLKTKYVSTTKLNELLAQRRDLCQYPMDGLVICKSEIPEYVESDCVREDGNPINPKWSIAFKSSSQQTEYITTVTKVEWNPSKTGLLIPIIHFEPVEMGEVKVSKASGQNAEFITNNNIGPGASVVIVRSGDVIPYVAHVVKGSLDGPSYPQDVPIEWNSNGKNLLAPKDSLGVKVQQIVHFCKVMGVKGLDQGVIEKLGVSNVKELLSLTFDEIKSKNGFSDKSAERILIALEVVKEQPLSIWMKASNCFSNISSVVLYALDQIYPDLINEDGVPSEEELLKIKGLGKKSVGALVESIQRFKAFAQEHSSYMNKLSNK